MNLNDFAKKKQAMQDEQTKQDFERLKQKFSNSYQKYKNKLAASYNTPDTSKQAYYVSTTGGNGGGSAPITTSNATAWTTTAPNSSGILPYNTQPNLGVYGYGTNNYGTITTGGTLVGGNSSSDYYIDASQNWSTNTTPSIRSFGERVFAAMTKQYGWTAKRDGIKVTNYEELVGKFLPEVQGYYYYKRLESDEKANKSTPTSPYIIQGNTPELKAMSEYQIIVECLVLDLALVTIKQDKEYLKNIVDLRTSTEWTMRLILDAFGDMLRTLVDRDEGTARPVDYSYYTWFVQYLKTGINTIYGDLSVEATPEESAG